MATKAKGKQLGYIVALSNHGPCYVRASQGPEWDGRLWIHGLGVTVFPTRAAARNAIRRTVRHAAKHLAHLAWTVKNFSIYQAAH